MLIKLVMSIATHQMKITTIIKSLLTLMVTMIRCSLIMSKLIKYTTMQKLNMSITLIFSNLTRETTILTT